MYVYVFFPVLNLEKKLPGLFPGMFLKNGSARAVDFNLKGKPRRNGEKTKR